MSIARLIPSLIVVAALSAPSKSAAEDFYFMTVYGAQRPIINQARYTHTWATFIKLSGCGADLRTYRAESFTISWLPATLEVKPQRLRPEPGINLTLQQTLEQCDKNRMEVAQFGPYQIKPELYALAIRRFDQLERRELTNRASDLFNAKRTEETCNCIYAVLDIDGRDPTFRPVTLGFGDIGSAFVVRILSPYIVDRKQTYPCVTELIGASNYRTLQFGKPSIFTR